jgi:predicted RNA binding protein YcfA (HicA-like mRNA interferase family)
VPKWRVLPGEEVLAVLARFGFHEVSQSGSHVKVQRIIDGAGRQSLTAPLHRELD